MDNRDFDLLKSYSEAELFIRVMTITDSIHKTDIRLLITTPDNNIEIDYSSLDDELIQLKNEIDFRLSLSNTNFSVPWGCYNDLTKTPYAKLLYNLSLPITSIIYLKYNLTCSTISCRDLERINGYNDGQSIEGKYYCTSRSRQFISKYVSEEYPGYFCEYKIFNEIKPLDDLNKFYLIELKQL